MTLKDVAVKDFRTAVFPCVVCLVPTTWQVTIKNAKAGRYLMQCLSCDTVVRVLMTPIRATDE